MSALDEAQSLLAAIADWPRPVFVLLDGAQHADLAGSFGRIGIRPRPLFLPQPSNPGLVKAGPWLALLDSAGLQRLLLAPHLGGELVLWGGTVGEEAAVRHFRGLNLIQMPRQTPGVAGQQVALFRHYDPSVLAMVYPVLQPAQRARLFGPFNAVLLHSARPGTKRLSRRNPDWPPPPHGWLRFSPEQMKQISGTMTSRSHQAIASYLRTVAPDHTQGMDDEGLLAQVAESEQSGRALGLRSERGLGRWSYLELVSDGLFGQSEEARRYITAGPGNPDQNVSVLMKGVAHGLRQREQRA